MTKLDSILKSRDITLSTNVHLVKAMVFPVVMYRCESWTIKKVERQRIYAFELWCWEVPWTARDLQGTASPTQWTWVWIDSRSWWWTGRPGVPRFTGSQSWTRLSNWTELRRVWQPVLVNTVQHSCLENSLSDREALQATVYRVAKTQTEPKRPCTHKHKFFLFFCFFVFFCLWQLCPSESWVWS